METTETKETTHVTPCETRGRVKKAVVVLTLGLVGGALAVYKLFKSKTYMKK